MRTLGAAIALLVLLPLPAVASAAATPPAAPGRLLPSAATPAAAAAEPAGRRDPRRRLPLFADPLAAAARQGPAYRSLARAPQALWVTDATPARRVGAVVRSYAVRAARARRTPLLTVYGIPARDCGLHSAGGLPTARAYRAWVTGIARGLRGTAPLVVLEPDALASLGACAGQGDRTGLLRWAGARLTRAGAWVYLDAGNSDWQPAEVTAARLVAAGVRGVRGFSLNVSGFRPLAEAQAYAARVAAELARHGVAGRRYVVDTSRSGAAAPVSGEWCNPTWARVGAAPGLAFRGAFDGTLWVKHPGESDGPCNGGGTAGSWCDALADRLLGRDPAAPGC